MAEAADPVEALERDGRAFEAALLWRKRGQPTRALGNLTRVGAQDPHYREACRMAIQLAPRCGAPSLAFENLLAAYVRAGPREGVDADAFDSLAHYYEVQGYPENAAEALRKLLAVRQTDREARARLARIDAGLSGEPGRLPDLPPLPSEPPPSAQPQPQEEEPTDRYTAVDEALAAPFRLGAVLGNRYRIEERIGSGGTSVVFRARDLELGDAVAVKVFKEVIYDRESDERLRREVRLSHRIVHRNVVQLYDLGTDSGFRFISMELLEGFELRARMQGRPMPVGEALDALLQACTGLHAAHELGIIHRDIKPENCFVTRDGVLKLMDFGIAKMRNAPGVTTTGRVWGTPDYMAPEQTVSFRDVTHLADIYSLGVMAYEAFTGALPFSHPEAIRVLMMHVSAPPPPPRQRNPALSPEIERIVLECLEKEPTRRPRSAAVVAERLAALLRLPGQA